MNAREAAFDPADWREAVADRIAAIDWTRAANDLDGEGHAIIERLLTRDECDALADLYARDDANDHVPQQSRDGAAWLWPRRVSVLCLPLARDRR